MSGRTARAAAKPARRAPQDARHRARAVAVQCLYQWEIGRGAIEAVVPVEWDEETGSATDAPPSEDDRTFGAALARGVADHVSAIDPIIGAAAEHWRVERMNVLDRIILRLAVYEFLHRPETPAKVVINEALELARTFSTDEAVGFINGILDAIRRTLERA